LTPSIVRVSNLVTGDTPTHQHHTDGTSARGKQNAHPIAVVDEAVNDPRDKEPVAFVEAHGTVVAGDHQEHVRALRWESSMQLVHQQRTDAGFTVPVLEVKPMEFGFGTRGVEVQETDDLPRPLRHEEVRARSPLATLDAFTDRRRRVGLPNNGVEGCWINETRILCRHRLGSDGGDGISIPAGRIAHEYVSSGQHVRT
jgi:hypothetical protein